MRFVLSMVSLSAAVMMAAPAQAATFWSGNGHYYEFIAGDVKWTDALAAAASAAPIAGYTSYLATVTDSAENAFIISIPGGSARGWIAASDDGSEGNFSWRAGPENGQAIAYSNWAGGEPNNCCGGENYVQLNYHSPGTWNDLAGLPGQQGFNDGYFVEYSASVPEPASWALLIAGFGLTGAAMRRRAKVRITYA